ncbi:MAG: 2,3-bisphosphoglycerate-dependent phosphoglycerate mutase [Hyphomicrobiales bacterium]|nr:2,3-bisphosphoglycerate-dependent phosphoglycerate mutase [Hyphomicrobiales bacterium]
MDATIARTKAIGGDDKGRTAMTVARRTLVLARHGQSEGNQRNIFTGWRDLPLTELGEREAEAAGRHLGEIGCIFNAAFASRLSRAASSCSLMLGAMGLSNISMIRDAALNERDCGDLTGLDKDEARQRFGREQVRMWRRSYALAPPNGESLRDTIARVLPFYIGQILPIVMRSQGVLVVAHGNSLRALIMALEGISIDDIPSLELRTAEMRLYVLDEDSAVKSLQSIYPG